MAEKLIDSLASDWDPTQYRDEYREELLAMIERKADGKEIVSSASEEPEPTKAPDLMAALEESIAAVRGDGGSKSKAKPKPRKKSTPAKKPAAKRSTNSSRSKAKSKS